MIKLVLVVLASPCSSCHILNNLSQEVIEKIQEKYGDRLHFEKIIVHNPNCIRTINGLEVEKFPAIILSGRQLTAGGVPNRRQIEYLIEVNKEAR